ncbi:MAG TPA: porin [Ramlibacter sp.]|nr:porin [Ramlibacter sp.]
MKNNLKMIAAACAVVATCGVQAQPLTRLTNNVTLYGIVDSGVERVTNVGAARATLTRVPTLTNSLPSRIGFRGAEDLGGGLWAQFVLETGIGVDAGVINQGGRFFGRQSFVGLSHNTWGHLTFGRQYDHFFLATLDAGVLGPNAYGLASLDPYIPAARFDNTIAYQNNFGNFGVGVNYSLGHDVLSCVGENAVDDQACRAASGFVKYTTQQWGVAAGYGKRRGGTGGAAGLVRNDLSDERLTVNGYFRGSNWKVGLGTILRDNEPAIATQQRSNLYWLEGSYAITPALALEGMVAQIRFKDSLTGDKARLLALRALYSFSKRSAAYITAGRLLNDGNSALSVSGASPGSNPVAGQGQTGLLIGIRTTF